MAASRSIDLHNFTVAEALREFVRFYNAQVRGGYRGRIEVIHGYGSNGTGGVIREELRRFLKAHDEVFGEFLPGESLRNPGVTIVYAKETPAPVGLGSSMQAGPGLQSRFRGSLGGKKFNPR
jgi:dsDNA-specific endonuclease/ATPase MutS2